MSALTSRLRKEAELALSTFRRILDELAGEGALDEQKDLHQQLSALTNHSRLSITSQTPERNDNSRSVPQLEAQIPESRGAAAKPTPARVEVADGIYVEAMVLPAHLRTYEEVLQTIVGPMLCYVPSWGQFAIRIGGGLIHGNVGNILSHTTKHPMGVKPCTKKECSDPGCRYYHDPLKLALDPAPSVELPLRVRNYMAESFLYCPRTMSPPSGVRYGGRHFGNASSLGLDLEQLSPSERRRFLDQVAHDMICAAILLHNPA